MNRAVIQLQFNFSTHERSRKIISDFFKSRTLDKLISKMNPPELRDDLRQDLMIILLEKDEQVICDLHAKKHLAFYAARIVMNMVKSTRSPFHYTYRKDAPVEFSDNHTTSCTPDHVSESDEFIHRKAVEDCERQMYDDVCDELEGMHWYDRELFIQWYQSDENAAEVQRKTGIPSRSILTTVNKVKAKLQKL